jgi:hypothetical protein
LLVVAVILDFEHMQSNVMDERQINNSNVTIYVLYEDCSSPLSLSRLSGRNVAIDSGARGITMGGVWTRGGSESDIILLCY